MKLLNVSIDSPDFIHLLDISLILEVRTIYRRVHQFANKWKSFAIETRSNQVFVLEAQTVAERDRVVVGLKMIVARIASLLMLKDPRVEWVHGQQEFCK